MKEGMKISLVILGIFVFVGFVCAQDSFYFLKEDASSYEAVVVYDVDFGDIRNNPETIIRLNRNEGDFTDLINYIKSSKITKLFYYSSDNLDSDFIKLMKTEAGVNVRMLIGGGVDRNTEESDERITPEDELIITGEVITLNGEETNNSLITIIFILLGVLVLFIVLRLIFRRKRKLKKK
jgi:hypothetical protein